MIITMAERASNFNQREEPEGASHGVIIFHKMSKSLKLYELSTEKWTKIQNMTPRMIRNPNFTSIIVDNHIYVISSSGEVQRLDYTQPSANWEQMENMIFDHGESPPTAVLDGSIYVFGGSRISAPSNGERFDITKDKWIQITNSTCKRSSHSLVTCGGLIYCIGGKDESGKTMSSAECIQPGLTSWFNIAAMEHPRHSATTVAYDGKIYVLGGEDDDSILSVVECYDPYYDKWFPLASLFWPTDLLCGFGLNDQIFLIRKWSIDVLDLENNEWRNVKFFTDKDILAAAATKDGLSLACHDSKEEWPEFPPIPSERESVVSNDEPIVILCGPTPEVISPNSSLESEVFYTLVHRFSLSESSSSTLSEPEIRLGAIAGPTETSFEHEIFEKICENIGPEGGDFDCSGNTVAFPSEAFETPTEVEVFVDPDPKPFEDYIQISASVTIDTSSLALKPAEITLENICKTDDPEEVHVSILGQEKNSESFTVLEKKTLTVDKLHVSFDSNRYGEVCGVLDKSDAQISNVKFAFKGCLYAKPNNSFSLVLVRDLNCIQECNDSAWNLNPVAVKLNSTLHFSIDFDSDDVPAGFSIRPSTTKSFRIDENFLTEMLVYDFFIKNSNPQQSTCWLDLKRVLYSDDTDYPDEHCFRYEWKSGVPVPQTPAVDAVRPKQLTTSNEMRSMKKPIFVNCLFFLDLNEQCLLCQDVSSKSLRRTTKMLPTMIENSPLTMVVIDDNMFALTTKYIFRLSNYFEDACSWEQLIETMNSDHGTKPPVAVARGSIFVVGASTNKLTAVAERFHPETGKWEQICSLEEQRSHTMLVEANDCIYCIGGKNIRCNDMDSVVQYDFESNMWKEVSPMKYPRSGGSAIAINNRIYVIGGESRGQPISSIDFYDPVNDSWFGIYSLPVFRQPTLHVCVSEDRIIFAKNESDVYHSFVPAQGSYAKEQLENGVKIVSICAVEVGRLEDVFQDEVMEAFVSLSEFKKFARSRRGLRLSHTDVENACHDFTQLESIKMDMLWKWKEQKGKEATIPAIRKIVENYRKK